MYLIVYLIRFPLDDIQKGDGTEQEETITSLSFSLRDKNNTDVFCFPCIPLKHLKDVLSVYNVFVVVLSTNGLKIT